MNILQYENQAPVCLLAVYIFSVWRSVIPIKVSGTDNKTTGTLFCPELKTELVHTAFWTLAPVEQDAHLWRTCYRGAGGNKRANGPWGWGPELPRTQAWMTTNCSSCIQIPCASHTDLQGPGGIWMPPHMSLSLHANMLIGLGACRDGVNMVRCCGVVSSHPATPSSGCILRDSLNPSAWTPDPKSDAFRSASTWLLSRAFRCCPLYGPIRWCGPSMAILTSSL